MNVRVSTIKMAPDQVEPAVAHFRETILPQAQELPGFEGATLLANQDRGVIKLLTYWAERGDLDASAESATRLRSEMIKRAAGELVSVEIYQVALEVTSREE
jgi:heme-degrading monooxygenase HmoA